MYKKITSYLFYKIGALVLLYSILLTSIIFITVDYFYTEQDSILDAHDLYFYSNGGTVDPATGADLTQISMSTSSLPIATGLDTLEANVSTYKVGDFPRFIAEFLIIARE